MVLYPLVGLPVRILLAAAGAMLVASGSVHQYTNFLAVALWPFSGLGVTAGAHRLWTHGSYKASVLMEALLIVMFSMADQGRITDWCLTHKAHHRFSDTDKDPHNRARGFWYSHFGWALAGVRIDIPQIDIFHFVSRCSRLVRLHDQCSLVWDPRSAPSGCRP